MLLLSSMFAFALVFHAVTQPAADLPARYDVQLTRFAIPAASEPASVLPPLAIAPIPLPPPILTAIEAPVIAVAAAPVLDALPPAAPTLLRGSALAVAPDHGMREAGAVTRVFATTSSALRSAFRKAF